MTTSTPAAQQREADEAHEDVSPMSSDADDSDFDNDPAVRNARDSTEVAQHDLRVLDEEEERENLLTSGTSKETPKGLFGRRRKDEQSGAIQTRKARRRSRRSRRKRANANGTSRDEQGELMYEMEEGGARDDTSSQASSSSAELDKLNLVHASTSRKRRRPGLWVIIGVIIAALFSLLTFGAYRVSESNDSKAHLQLKSNGTSVFAPTTILISLDGFRADFLRRGITPTLNQFVAEGVSPRYMLPSFPSVTFPNHYTLVTGLYPESHGVVGNSFWDPDLEEEFWYTDPARSMDPKWWAGGEPLWVTAEKQSLTTAIHMWPGSEAGMDFSATFLDKFNGSEVLSKKTERVLELLDLPGPEEHVGSNLRPQLIAAYVPVVDADGHKYGPNSTEIWSTISEVDVMLHNLFLGLEERNLTSLVNVVVVSDHGMATTSVDRCVQLDDLIDLDLIKHIDGWPLYGLRPKNSIDLRGLYDRLLVESQASGNFEVYLRDENMPDRYHFSKNDRIAPLWVVPKTGWAIVHKEDFDVKEAKIKGEEYHPKGLHGYDHEHPLMRAIFVARGPAFPHKPNSRLDVFQNTEVYNIVCDSLGIVPKPNNGTLRLPLKPVGLHSDSPEEPTPSDGSSPPEKQDSQADPASPDDGIMPSNHTGPEIISDQQATADQMAAKTEQQKEEAKEEMNEFWAYVKAKMKAAQEWANKVIASLKANHKGKEKQEQDKSFDQGSQS